MPTLCASRVSSLHADMKTHSDMKTHRLHIAGFTAIELMVVVAIVAVLAKIAAPSFSSLIATQRAGSSTTELHIAMIKTRSEATKRNANVWLCPKTSGGSGWKDGWQIQVSDCSSLAVTTLDNHSPVVGSTISGPASVEYQSSGRVQGSSTPAFNVTSNSGSSSTQKYLCVGLSGRPLVQATSCS